MITNHITHSSGKRNIDIIKLLFSFVKVLKMHDIYLYILTSGFIQELQKVSEGKLLSYDLR